MSKKSFKNVGKKSLEKSNKNILKCQKRHIKVSKKTVVILNFDPEKLKLA